MVWEEEEEESHFEINLSAKDIVLALIHKLQPNPLDVETAAVIQKMKNTIPSGPVAEEPITVAHQIK